MQKQMWDEHYSTDEYTYGIEPNDLVRDEVGRIPPGRVLCLAEGEGRNAVFLASRGYDVTAVDFSSVGLRKAERLARERDVRIELIEADLATFDLGSSVWSGIVSIWAHTPPAIRKRVHSAIPLALRPGGILILEAYRPKQLGTLELLIARESDREIHEGRAHSGPSATVQIVGRRRA